MNEVRAALQLPDRVAVRGRFVLADLLYDESVDDPEQSVRDCITIILNRRLAARLGRNVGRIVTVEGVPLSVYRLNQSMPQGGRINNWSWGGSICNANFAILVRRIRISSR